MSTQQQEIEGTRERNFYGVTRVVTGDEVRSLHHGTTLHGEQFLDAERELLPTSYYAPHSGIGNALRLQQRLTPERGLAVGIIGLGTGTLAAYCRPQDTFTYYEIDERMVRIASEDFSFIHSCANLNIKIGDGRTLLASEAQHTTAAYDILAVDAFSDDSVPAHLVTKEAVALFMEHVNETGILAIHTSNRYIDLTSVVVRIAQELALPVTVVNDNGDEEGASASVWILLSRSDFIAYSESLAGTPGDVPDTTPLWTDEYTNIFPVLFTPITLHTIFGDMFSTTDTDEATDEDAG